MSKDIDCKICSCKPVIIDGWHFEEYESTIDLTGGTSAWTSLRGGKDRNNKVVIRVAGDDEVYYYPKYCPECGRKLHD